LGQIPTINVLFENGLAEKKLLSLPAIITAVGAYIAIFEPNLIGVTSLLLYIRRRHNNGDTIYIHVQCIPKVEYSL